MIGEDGRRHYWDKEHGEIIVQPRPLAGDGRLMHPLVRHKLRETREENGAACQDSQEFEHGVLHL